MFDIIVVGLGAVGSATLHTLARRGVRVLGIDRYSPPHVFGSTHGGSRIIRKAYFEGERYLPLLERAYTLWADLEAESGQSLTIWSGCLNVGPRDGATIEGARRSAEELGLRHEMLSRAQAKRRFPAFTLPVGSAAFFEHWAGLIRPERCVAAQLELAQKCGAQVRFKEPVLDWEPEGSRVTVTTGNATYRADRLVLCAGAWMNDLTPNVKLPLQIERVTNAWFVPKARANLFVPERCPVFIQELSSGVHLYGLPDLGRGVKAGLHYAGHIVSHPLEVSRAVTDEDTAAVREGLEQLLPDAAGEISHAAVCLYTNTPDKHWLIDTLMVDPLVVFASACSGHGFKASVAVGEGLADLVMEKTSTVDVTSFRQRT